MASTTLSKLSRGSPMPIITTLVIARSILAGTVPKAWLAMHTWPMISAAVRSLLKPCLPVEQKLQSSAQPAWEDTQRVPRPFCGIYTVSTQLPDATRTTHLRVPSLEMSSLTTSGPRISARALSFSLSALPRLVMSSKLSTPKGCIHFMTCPARKRFSPSSSKNASSLAWVRPSRFTFAASVIAIHHSSGVCGRASGAGAQLGFGEEVADFTGSRSGGVGTVDGVGVDGLGEVGTDGTGSGFLGVGGAHQLAVLQYG